MRRLLKVIAAIILIATAVSWLTSVAYGQTNDTAQLHTTTIPGLEITATPQSDAPAATFYGNAIGSVKSGDLFFINAVNVPQDMTLNLYITNIDQMVPVLRYMTLEIIIYREDAAGQWEKVQLKEGAAFPPLFLTMRNGQVMFDLPGLARYKVTVGSGSFYCNPAGENMENTAPQFYLEAASM